MEYTIGEKVNISLKDLYQHSPNTEYGHIRHSVILGEDYYDYYLDAFEADYGTEFLLCDGEEVTVKEITDKEITFTTDEGFDFRFTREEAGISVFKSNAKKEKTADIER